MRDECIIGVKTGLNEAFIINQATRDRLVKETQIVINYQTDGARRRFTTMVPGKRRTMVDLFPSRWTLN